jgi:acetyl esterase/lipase
MDGGLLKFLVPKIPSLANTALWHTLGKTATSDQWDLRTALTVQVLRSVMSGGEKEPSPVGKVQASTLKDPGVKGKTWVANATIPAPTEDHEGLRHAVFTAIDQLSENDIKLEYTKPSLVDTQIEWTGFRPNAGKNDTMPDISEAEKYSRMMAEPTRTSDTTILYFHGGAYYLCDPSTHRAITSRLVKESNGVVCSVRYRLAPQAAFPSQLLDALLVYLSLLYPPPGSLHAAVPASKIVLAGDSAGGNLVFALLQFLLHFNRSQSTGDSSSPPTIDLHGSQVSVPLPAAATAAAGWFDISRALPSITANAKYDYLPPATHSPDALSRFPADSIWPTTPPRGDLFCDLSLLDHPLVSPLLAQSWEGSPPLYFNTGEEMLTDEIKVLASRAAQQGVKVVFEEYQAMPHCFAMLLPGLEASERCVKAWGAFAKRAVEEGAQAVETKGTWIEVRTGREESRVVSDLSNVSFEEAGRLVREAKGKRLGGEEGEAKGLAKAAL